MSEIRFEVEWLPAPGVKSRELRATWARLELLVDGEPLTHVFDVEARTSRRSIFASAYPLAEWLAFNWWFLLAHDRPGYLPDYYWTFRSRIRHGGKSSDWLKSHNLRAVGDGFPWPDLTLVPSDGHVQMVWRGDRRVPPTWGVKFLSYGEAVVTRDELAGALSNFVEGVLVRLREEGVEGTALEEEWEVIRAAEPGDVDFCMASARLGLDPYAVPDDTANLIVKAGADLGSALLQDFLAAANPSMLSEDLAWVQEARNVVRRQHETPLDLPAVKVTDGNLPPWRRGADAAARFRSAVGAFPGQRMDLDRWLVHQYQDALDRSIEGLGGLSAAGSRVLVSAVSRPTQGQRFSTARSLYRFLAGDGEHLLTYAKGATQQAERAFAAELLAPVSGIRDLVSDEIDYLRSDEILELSQHFDVSEWVIRFQVLNNLDIGVDEPELLDP